MAKYNHPDEFAHVYSWARSEQEAEKIRDEANQRGETRDRKFVAGSFRIEHIPGRVPAVVGDLTGN